MSILDASYIGKGKTFAQNNSTGTAGLEAFGNVSALSISHEESEASILDYTRPGGAKRNTRSRVDAVTVSLTLTDFNADNLKRLLRGSVSTVSTAPVTAESISVPATLDTDTLVETTAVIDTTESVTVTSDPAGTTYVDGTDYEVVGRGIVILPGGSISASDDLLVSYTSKTVDKVEAITGSSPEFRIVFSGVNEAQSDVPLIVTMYKVKLNLPASLDLISDEFGQLELTGELLADSAISASNESQYYKVEIA